MQIVRTYVIRVMILTAALLTNVSPARAGWPAWSRYWGHGWSDGYHSGEFLRPHDSQHRGTGLPWLPSAAGPFPEGEPLPAQWPQARHNRSGSAQQRGSSLFRQAGEGSSI